MKHTLPTFLAVAALATWATPALAITSAELIRNQAYVYGRFEARLRFAPGEGVVSSFFLWKNGSEVSGTFWNELDFEKLGADCHLQTNALFGAPVTDHSRTESVDADLCADYHTYAFEWTPTAIVWLVDGIEVRREADETAAAFADNAQTGMQFRFNVWPGDASFGGDLDSAILPVQQYISWVQYSSYEEGAFALKWREDFDAGKLPSGWSTGNWTSPKGKSVHSASNATFSSGIAVLSLTQDDATGFTGTPPSDQLSGGGTSGTGGTTSTETSSGGSSSTGVGTGGAGPSDTSTANASPGDDGCGCRVAGTAGAPGARWTWLGLGLVAALRRRRARRAA